MFLMYSLLKISGQKKSPKPLNILVLYQEIKTNINLITVLFLSN